MCACVHVCFSCGFLHERTRAGARARPHVGVDGHCSVTSSYATLHIQLTYKYNDVTIRTTLLPRVSIQRDATRRSKGVFLWSCSETFRYFWFRAVDCRKKIFPKSAGHSFAGNSPRSLCVDFQYKKSCCWGAVGLEYDDRVQVSAMG